SLRTRRVHGSQRTGGYSRSPLFSRGDVKFAQLNRNAENEMSDRDSKLEQLGYPLERTAPEGSLVDGLIVDRNTIYASGQVPFDGERLTSRGKVPSQVSMEHA